MTADRLRDVIDRYRCLESIRSHAQTITISDPSGKYVSMFSLPHVGRKIKNKREQLESYFNQLKQSLINNCILELIANFEEIIFTKVGNASGETRSVVAEKYKAKPFYRDGGAFVKTHKDIGNLSDVKFLLPNTLSSELSKQLSEIIRHRNWLAHGGRIGEPSSLNIDEIYSTLQEILDRVRN